MIRAWVHSAAEMISDVAEMIGPFLKDEMISVVSEMISVVLPRDLWDNDELCRAALGGLLCKNDELCRPRRPPVAEC